jgi:O-antigen/teichoic acid export membrane protein
MIVGALGQSATPRLALYAARDKTEFRSLSYRLLLIGMALGILGILGVLLCGRPIVALIYGREYAQSYPLLVWLMIAGAAGYMAAFAGYSLTAARHFQVQLPLFALITFLTLVLCYAMVQSAGSLGAARALAIVGFIQLAATMAILHQKEARSAGGIS